MKRVVAQRADAVIANTDAALAHWQEEFPLSRDKFHVIWNGFDPEERIRPLPVLSRHCKILSHLGEVYHGGKNTTIVESIARLLAANRLPKGGVRVQLIGPAQTECLPNAEVIHRAQSEGWLELVTKLIPKQDALQVAQTSNGLLLMQSQSADHVPAKIFDCLQIGRPILAVVQPNSPAERLLERSGVPYRCVYPDSSREAIDDIVAGFLDLPSEAVAPSPWFEANFNAALQTQALDSVICSLYSEQPSRALTAQLPRKTFQTTKVGDST